MSLREHIEKHRGLATVIAAALAAGAVAMVLTRSGGTLEKERFFYDLGTGKVFAGDAMLTPAIASESGEGMGVGAIVFSCSNCDDESSRFVAWLEKYTDAAKQVMASGNAAEPSVTERIEAGHLIAAEPVAGSDAEWIVEFSARGMGLRKAMRERCMGEGTVRVCRP